MTDSARWAEALYYNTNTITLTPTPGNSAEHESSRPRSAPRPITATQCTAGIQFLMNVAVEARRRRASRSKTCSSRAWTITSTARTTRSSTSTGLTFVQPTDTARQHVQQQLADDQRADVLPRALPGGRIDHADRQSSVNEVHGQWGRDLETAGANARRPVCAIGAAHVRHAQRSAPHCRAG